MLRDAERSPPDRAQLALHRRRQRAQLCLRQPLEALNAHAHAGGAKPWRVELVGEQQRRQYALRVQPLLSADAIQSQTYLSS